MDTLIDAAVQLRQRAGKRKRPSIVEIREYVDNVDETINRVCIEREQIRSFNGVSGQLILTTLKLMHDCYKDYLCSADLLSSNFFIHIRYIFTRSFNENRYDNFSDEEKNLLNAASDILFVITESTTQDIVSTYLIPLFFERFFILSMVGCLNDLKEGTSVYCIDQKVFIIKVMLNMFSKCYVSLGDETFDKNSVKILFDATLRCISSNFYLDKFVRLLEGWQKIVHIKLKTEVFIAVCPRYAISFAKGNHGPYSDKVKSDILKSATRILELLVPRLLEVPDYIIEYAQLLIEVLLLIPVRNFIDHPNLIQFLVNIVQLFKRYTDIGPHNEKLVRLSVSLIYSLTIDVNLCGVVRDSLPRNKTIKLFKFLSSEPTDRHIKFVSGLILWALERYDGGNIEYGLRVIRKLSTYLQESIEDPQQQHLGVPLGAIVTSVKDLLKNEDSHEEMVKQNVVQALMQCGTRPQFDAKNIQYPSLESLLTLSFLDKTFEMLSDPEFIDTMKTLLHQDSRADNTAEVSQQLKKVADGLMWKLENELQSLKKRRNGKPKYDAMLSYEHGDYQICKQIYDRLTNEGFRVWFDQNDIYGNMMDSISEAIDNSEFVLVCLSRPYSHSPYCRLEANYAFRRKIRIIPLKLHEDIYTSGWLSLLIADLAYINFAKKPFDDAIKDVIIQIGKHQNTGTSGEFVQLAESAESRLSLWKRIVQSLTSAKKLPENNNTGSNDSELNAGDLNGSSHNDTETLTTSKMKTSSSDVLKKSINLEPIKRWTTGDLHDFFSKNKLEKFAIILTKEAGCDGNDLIYLYDLLKSDSRNGYNVLKKENEDITLSDYTKFLKTVEKYMSMENL